MIRKSWAVSATDCVLPAARVAGCGTAVIRSFAPGRGLRHPDPLKPVVRGGGGAPHETEAQKS